MSAIDKVTKVIIFSSATFKPLPNQCSPPLTSPVLHQIFHTSQHVSFPLHCLTKNISSPSPTTNSINRQHTLNPGEKSTRKKVYRPPAALRNSNQRGEPETARSIQARRKRKEIILSLARGWSSGARARGWLLAPKNKARTAETITAAVAIAVSRSRTELKNFRQRGPPAAGTAYAQKLMRSSWLFPFPGHAWPGSSICMLNNRAKSSQETMNARDVYARRGASSPERTDIPAVGISLSRPVNPESQSKLIIERALGGLAASLVHEAECAVCFRAARNGLCEADLGKQLGARATFSIKPGFTMSRSSWQRFQCCESFTQKWCREGGPKKGDTVFTRVQAAPFYPFQCLRKVMCGLDSKQLEAIRVCCGQNVKVIVTEIKSGNYCVCIS